jgi:hypothetical protein
MKSYKKLPTTWLYFHLEGDGVEWIDQDLPIPNYLEHKDKSYIIGYEIIGYFGTQKSQEYLNDMIARVLITFRDLKAYRLNYKPLPPLPFHSIRYAHTLRRPYDLKELQGLKSIEGEKYLPRQSADNFDDHTFWAIKFHCEELIKRFGVPEYKRLESFAFRSFEGKEYSTLRAKCRSVWNWYDKRDWEIPKGYKKVNKSKEQIMASRQEHIKKVNENRELKTRNKIRSLVDDIFMQDQIKLKNGKFKISAIAKLTEIHRKTVAKHLKKMGLI